MPSYCAIINHEGQAPQDASKHLPQAHQNDILFSDIEALFEALGGAVEEGRGWRVRLVLAEARLHMHRPHPGKDAKKYQVEEVRQWLTERDIKP